MRVLLLGAGGGMGRDVARLVAASTSIEGLTLADRSRDALAPGSAAARSGSAPTETAVVDVTDTAALGDALRSHDVVLNCTGPYFRFGVPVLAAAIEAGCGYLDLCDDWEPTLEMLQLDGRARAAGVGAIIGLGASPGISNLMARLVADELDEVADVWTA